MRINIALIGGNLVRDPEFKSFGNTDKAEFTIAINRRYKDSSGELKEEVDFVVVVAWGRNAVVARDYLKKGAAALVEGAIRQERWNDEHGNSRSKTKVYASRIFLSGRKPEAEGDHAQEN